jgi:glutathione S-transferase
MDGTGLRVVFAAGAVGVAYLLAHRLLRAEEEEPITLYAHPVSQPARACLSLVRAAGLSPSRVAIKLVALEKGEHKSPQYLLMNASGAVPALRDGEFGLGESHAIMRFLCARFGLSDFWYPADPHKRARVDEYLDWHHTHTRKGVPFFFHKYMAKHFGMTPDTLRRSEGRAHYEAAANFVENVFLARGAWIAGDAISIADLSCYAELGPLQWDDELGPVLDALPRLTRWLRAMGSQPWHEEVMADVAAIVQRGPP